MVKNIHVKEYSCKGTFKPRNIHGKGKELFQKSIGQGGFA